MVYTFYWVGSCAVLHVPVTPFGTEYRIFTVVAADSFEEIQCIHHKVRLKVWRGIYNVKGSRKLLTNWVGSGVHYFLILMGL